MSLDNELNASARLREVFSFWHKSAETYFEPEEFRINLNACIQSIRNVTFLLQKQKNEIENFNTWYKTWQEAMKNDPIMNWCVFARNKVVKQGDLEKRSIAKVEIIKSYLEPSYRTLIVSPFLKTSDIAKKIIDDSLPESIQKSGFLKVERIWSVEKLNNVEVLEALAHAFIVLNSLLNDAFQQKGVSCCYPAFKKRESFDTASSLIDEVRDIFPACMKLFSEYRVITIKLSSNEYFEFESISEIVSREDMLKIKDVYKVNFSDTEQREDNISLRDIVELYFDMGKKVLEVDGYHTLAITLIDKDKRPSIVQTRFNDQDEKYLFWQRMADTVKSKNIEQILVVGEVWQAVFNKGMKVTNATEAQHRTEALQVIGASSNGEEIHLSVPFTKEKGKVIFGEKQLVEDANIGFLMPIKRVWKNKS